MPLVLVLLLQYANRPPALTAWTGVVAAGAGALLLAGGARGLAGSAGRPHKAAR